MRTLSLLAVLVVLTTALGAAEGFRVDTDCFKEGEKTPFSETQTLFLDKQAYDFPLTKPIEITIFDADRGQVTLLDVERRMKTTVTTSELLTHDFALKSSAAINGKGLFAFAADPRFEKKIEAISENEIPKARLTLTGPVLSYTAIGVRPKQPDSVATYREFADCYARLNAARPGNLPAGARMALNRALAEEGLIPLQIQRTTTQDVSGQQKTLQVRSQHLVNWGLTGEDLKRVQDAKNMSATFTTTPFAEYCEPAKPVTNKQARK